MRLNLSLRGSIRAQLISSYLVILAIGGLVTSLVGSWIVSSTIMMQARRSVDRELAVARILYDRQLEGVRRTVHMTASGQRLAEGDPAALLGFLQGVRQDAGLDFLSLAGADGRVLLRVSQPGLAGDDVTSSGVVRSALHGRLAAGAEIAPAQFLANEDPALRDRARIHVVPTLMARPDANSEQTSGMVVIAAAPVRLADGTLRGVLYGGVLLNRNFQIVDRVWEPGQDAGTATIFQGDVRISTNVRTETGERALGTRVSDEVRAAVLEHGGTWRGRAFVVRDWYLSAYDPIRGHDGAVIGMLYVGLLERAYTSIRDRVILSFFAIATTGFLLIAAITYYMIRNITRPIGEMAAAARNIAAGRFDQEVRTNSPGELARLADSFNTMTKSLCQMKADLEEWGATLEEKVRQRTEELVAMHDRVAQSERLASLGKLAAGVAHEINNPLGGVLALTALTLEDLAPDDPDRENLEEVLKQAQRCRDIVKGLLEFSRQSPGHAEACDLNKVLEDTVSLIASQSIFLNIQVVWKLDPQLPAVMADKSQLQQVFMNFLMNAVQAMDERGTVAITTRRAEDGWAEIVISDTGCGIPPEKIDRIFDPFFTTKASGKGTGLGLSIAYGIITEHHGAISVASEAGQGSAFTIRLPGAGAPQGTGPRMDANARE